MIVADGSSDDSHDNHEHVRGVLESMGLDPDADGYEADSDTSKSYQESEPSEGDDESSSDDTYGDLPP